MGVQVPYAVLIFRVPAIDHTLFSIPLRVNEKEVLDFILVNVRCLNKTTTSPLKRVTTIQGSRTDYQSCSILLFMSCKCYHHLCL